MVELSNAALTNIKGQQADNADLTITMNRSDLETVMMGKATFDEQIASGKAKLEGDRKPYDELKGMLVQLDMGLEILPGTGGTPLTAPKGAFEQQAPAINTISD